MNRRLIIGALIAGLALLFLWLTGPKHIPHGAVVPSNAHVPSQHSEGAAPSLGSSHSDAARIGVSGAGVAPVSLTRTAPAVRVKP